MEKEYFTIKEAAIYASVSPDTIRRDMAEGLSFYRIRRNIRIKKRALDDWIEKGKEDSKRVVQIDKYLELTNSIRASIYGDGGLDGFMSKGKSLARYNFGPFGAIYQRKTTSGKVRWYLDYHANGKRIQKVGADTKEEAAKALIQEHDKILSGKHESERKKGEIGFREFSQIYLEDYAMTDKKSWQTDEFRLRTLKEFFKDTQLIEITPLMIRRFRTFRLKNGIAKVTTNRDIALLKKMFNIAIEENRLEQNPARKVKLFSEMDTVRDRVLSEKEEARLFEELAEHVKPFVLIALNTGLRYGEILELKWSNVNLEKEVIKVEKAKSKKVRFIPINSTLFDELIRLKAEREKGQHVFPFKSVRTAFENACERAEIEDFTFHDLRRTFGTRLLEKGVDIVTISRLYGHSSVLVTQRYLHPKDTLSKEAVELLVERPKEAKKVKICDTSCDTAQVKKLSNASFSMN